MRSIVIDANVFHAYVHETILGSAVAERTGSARPIFDTLGVTSVAFIDSGRQIESEWRALTMFAQEWFGAWLADAFAEGRLFEIDPSSDPQLNKRYRKVGFPGGKDIWYVRTAHGLTLLCRRSRPCLIAEDIDFYDPAKKATGNKCAVFRAGTGPVSKQLKDDGIDLRCIEMFCKEI